ncbi:MAG: glycogen/starch synthase, partial [Planctomycetota bacterium]
MQIVFVATEHSPLCKVGGMADVVSALPRALADHGQRVTIVLPWYPWIEAEPSGSVSFQFGFDHEQVQ